ncbi:glucosamine inositolphosphorylceramide transferase family protein [Acinetobacter stercoris]|uniref:Glucosamine inositolphosphorylceramide transferase 1 N-terminal domain-containing protein n=1 Tax=Acinetobacter stercoris TaxID=2126983 RepID=A0A2U3N465_9GAMM|nr:hypothetical protein [Acinetobacter stercoris]SPL72433.1 hypothetical protein KPC_3611 [Acinetobacter stercoris]
MQKRFFKIIKKIQSLRYQSHWYIRFGWVDKEQNLKQQMQNLFEMHPSSSEYLYADCFYAKHENRHFIFLEEIHHSHEHGFISVSEVFKDGTYTAPKAILKLGYHLSFPCIFKIENDWYMIPETCKNHTIELWKASHFPFVWEKHNDLMNNIIAADTVPFYHQGYWYLFTSIRKDCKKFGDRLDIFFTKDILNPEWKTHPQNPVCKGLLNQRMAGIPFNYQNKLIRPAQNSIKGYGAEIELKEITQLTPEHYSERFIEKISPDWNKLDDGCHTINLYEDFIVLDAVRLTPKIKATNKNHVILEDKSN